MNRFITCLSLLMLTMVTSPLHAQGDPQAGQSKIQVCVACHGQTGNAIAPLFATIAGQGEKYLLKQLRDIQSGNREIVEMTGMLDSFTDQDLADIAAYFSEQEMQIAGAGQVTADAYEMGVEDVLALGEQIYRNGNMDTGVPACSGCHSPTGMGNFPAGYPRLGGQYREYIAKQLKNFQNNIRTNDGNTEIMRGVARPLSELEITAVSNYISGLN
jgi:cytochrome c553